MIRNEPIVVWWLKKDFRLRDNPALGWALETGRPVLPIFVVEPSSLCPSTAPETSAFHVAAWGDAVHSLRDQLRKNGSDLLVIHGEVIQVFDELHQKLKIHAVVSHEEVGNERTYARDVAFEKWCEHRGILWTQLQQTGVFRRLKQRSQRTRFWHGWVAAGPLQAPSATQMQQIQVPEQASGLACRCLTNLRSIMSGFELPDEAESLRQVVSEPEAWRVLDDFLLRRGANYRYAISSPNTAFESGSRLSVHLAWGTISIRDVYHATQARLQSLKNSSEDGAVKFRSSISSFKSRLHWRDHFIQRLECEPTMERYSLNRAYDQLPIAADADQLLAAWIAGRTGFPLVDACIRCAQTTGFLNFRMRSMITSLACHTLRLDWRSIMWPMARWWADYEPGIHLAQLQMQAGVVGINTLRIYNPAKQIADHDPDARFIKRWLPDLATATSSQIIGHQDVPLDHYPAPVVDWNINSTAMRNDYYAIRRSPAAQVLAEAVLEKHGSRKKNTKRTKRPKRTIRKKAKPAATQLRFDF